MAIAQSTYVINRIDETAVRVAFTSDLTAPVTFVIWHNGVRLADVVSQDAAGFVDIHAPIGESHDIQVFDVANSVGKPSYPGRVTLHWTAVSGADHYRVEQSISAVWTLKATIADDGQQAWTYLSDFLNDVTSYDFRVLAVDAAGNQGTALSFTVEMTRAPDIPSVTYTRSAINSKITIAAA